MQLFGYFGAWSHQAVAQLVWRCSLCLRRGCSNATGGSRAAEWQRAVGLPVSVPCLQPLMPCLHDLCVPLDADGFGFSQNREDCQSDSWPRAQFAVDTASRSNGQRKLGPRPRPHPEADCLLPLSALRWASVKDQVQRCVSPTPPAPVHRSHHATTASAR